jgi:hypothetical protein
VRHATSTLATEPAEPVRWEPCESPRVEEPGSVCAICGWTLEDHGSEPTTAPARAA